MTNVVRSLWRWQSGFNTVQKLGGLGAVSVGCMALTGNWVIFTGFLVSVILAVVLCRQLILYNSHLESEYLLDYLDLIESYVQKWKLKIQNEEKSFPAAVLQRPLNPTVCRDPPVAPEIEARSSLEHVIRDFVKSWYFLISEDDQFRDEIEDILDNIMWAVFDRLKNVRVENVVEDVVHLFQEHLKKYQEAEGKWKLQPNYRRKRSENRTEFKRIRTISQSFKNLGFLHAAMKSEQTEIVYLRTMMATIMQILFEKKVYECIVARELIMEILTCNVLGSVIDMVSEPHWLHQTIIQITSDEILINVDHNINSTPEIPHASIENDPEQTEAEMRLSKETSIDTRKWSDPDVKISGRRNSEQILHTSHRTPSPASQDQRLPNLTETRNEGMMRSGSAPVLLSLIPDFTNSTDNTAPSRDGIEDNFKTLLPSVPSVESINRLPVEGASRETEEGACGGTDIPRIPSQTSFMSFKEGSEHLDVNNIPQSSQFRPKFFIPSDDEASLCSYGSDASTFSGEGELGRRVKPDGGVTNSDQNDRPTPEQTLSMEHSQDHQLLSANSRNTSRSSTPNSLPGIIDISSSGVKDSCNLPFEGSLKFEAPIRRRSLSPEVRPVSFHESIEISPTASSISLESNLSDQGRRGSGLASIPKIIQEEVDVASEAFSELEGATHEAPLLIFQDVRVPKTENTKEPYSGNVYTLYVIEYIAWHRVEGTGSWCLKKDSVKRRFREFVTLHERLEEHMIYKRKIRALKGPTRWKALPFWQMESRVIETRRRLLQDYLKSLVLMSDVGKSLAVKEFLAYEGDASIAFVKKAPEIPRFDKFIVRSVSGMMNKITNVLPKLPDETSPQTPVSWVDSQDPGRKGKLMSEVSNDGVTDPHQFVIKFGYIHEEMPQVETVENTMVECIHAAEECDEEEGFQEADETNEFQDALEQSFLTPSILPRSSGDGCDVNQLPQWTEGVESQDERIRLAASVLDLAIQTASDRPVWVCHHNAISVLKILVGKAINKFLKKEISDLVTEERCAYYLRLLQDTLWPGGVLNQEPEVPPSDKQKEVTLNQAKRCLGEFLPGIIPLVVGHDDYDEAIEEIFKCIQHTTLNRHFVYCLADILVEHIFPEVCTRQFHQEIFASSPPSNEQS